MNEIFVNLKRFDVPRTVGGLCPSDAPCRWIESVMSESVQLGLGSMDEINLTYCLPEGLLPAAAAKVSEFPAEETKNLNVGVQGIFREDVVEGGNFGAFTTNLPAAAARGLGATWAIIGHSEERRDKLEMIELYDPESASSPAKREQASRIVNTMINAETICALNRGINVLICMGETAEEKGTGSFDEQIPRIESVLRQQVEIGLANVADHINNGLQIVIGYEPIWAIGPGKTPPGAEYIGFVSAYLKKAAMELYGFDPTVVYGGGLKEENAAMIAGVDTIGGGLVALTKFTPPIAFKTEDLKIIIEKYLA